MNILHLSTIDSLGSGTAAYRTHAYLKKAGYNSKMIVLLKSLPDDDVIQYPSNIFLKVLNKLRRILTGTFYRKIKNKNKKYCFYRDKEKDTNIFIRLLLKKIPFKPDIIIAHLVVLFMNSKNIYQLQKATGAPILLNFMDMESLTGGCHYAWDCEGYKNTCGNCPALYSNNMEDISYQNFKEKQKYIQKTNITGILASDWIEKRFKSSVLFANKKSKNILTSIDSTVFYPVDKSSVQVNFNLPENKKIIFIGASSVSEERKGFKYFMDALNVLNSLCTDKLKSEQIHLLIAGEMDESLFKDIPFKYTFAGFLKTQEQLVSAYQVADIFVCPSVEDGGPLMINEAIMCGTPVVAFRMGVAPNLVINDQTGYLAKLKDSHDLAKGMYNILSLDKKNYDLMSKNCRELALKLFHTDVYMKNLEELFKEVLSK